MDPTRQVHPEPASPLSEGEEDSLRGLRHAFRSWRRALRSQRAPYIQLPKEEFLALLDVTELGHLAFRLLLLLSLLTGEDGAVSRTDEQLAQVLGLSSRQVVRALNELQAKGMIQRIRPKGRPRLILLRPLPRSHRREDGPIHDLQSDP